jgi:hypothetical protein
VKFSDHDLDDIVENFEKLRDVHHVPLKFGHNDEQPMTDGQPAIGWVSKVYRKGSDLFADFAHVPELVMDAIKSKRYRTVSIEVMRNAKLDGEHIKTWFLDAVALLGADQPAVSGLSNLADLNLARASFDDGESLWFSKVGKFDMQNEVSVMDKKELQAAIDEAISPLKDQITDLQEAKTDLSGKLQKAESERDEYKRKVDDQAKEKEAETIKASRDAAIEVLDDAVKQKSITPAQREGLEASFGIKDDEQVVKLSLDTLKTACGWKEPKDKNKDSKMMQRNDDEDLSDVSLDQQVVMATRKVQANKPDLSYSEAQQIALGADPKLAKAYADSNGVFTADGGVDR